MATPLRLLMLEDNAADAAQVVHALRGAGYDPSAQRVKTEPEFRNHLQPAPDLILADFDLPNLGPLRALEILREFQLDIPFLLVSDPIGAENAVQVMQCGASNCVTKDRLTRLGPAVDHALSRRRLTMEKHKAEQAAAGVLRSLTKLANIGFGLALAVLGGIALLSFHNTQSLADAAESRASTLLTMDQLQEFLAAAMDVETGERGYVITGDPKFLEPYHSGMEQLGPHLQRLRAALANVPSQQPALDALEEATWRMRDHNQRVVACKASLDDASAKNLIATGRGKQFMDEVRQLIVALRVEEHEQLEQRDREFQAGLRWSLLIIVLGSGVGFVAVGLAAVAINRSLRQRIVLNTGLTEALADNTQMLNRLREASAELSRSNQELEQFAYVASHDLQEPLRKVSSFAQLLAAQYKGRLDADADDFIGFMVDGTRRMQALIQNLLAYSRLGRKGKPFISTDSNVALQQALANLQTAIEDARAAVTFGPLPTVIGDEGQLVQLFQNLIANALKFHGADPPRIQIQAEAHGSAWTYWVRDNGIGIDLRFAERIFLIFQRLHSREEYPGTGIGLAVCKKIVERHGGRIWLESQPGEGATFFFSLPRTHEKDDPKP